MQRIAVNPAVAPLVNGTNVRALRTRGFGDYPAITLYYTFDEDAVYPLHVEPYDLRVG